MLQCGDYLDKVMCSTNGTIAVLLDECAKMARDGKFLQCRERLGDLQSTIKLSSLQYRLWEAGVEAMGMAAHRTVNRLINARGLTRPRSS